VPSASVLLKDLFLEKLINRSLLFLTFYIPIQMVLKNSMTPQVLFVTIGHTDSLKGFGKPLCLTTLMFFALWTVLFYP
jgi:hypothetical protein